MSRPRSRSPAQATAEPEPVAPTVAEEPNEEDLEAAYKEDLEETEETYKEYFEAEAVERERYTQDQWRAGRLARLIDFEARCRSMEKSLGRDLTDEDHVHMQVMDDIAEQEYEDWGRGGVPTLDVPVDVLFQKAACPEEEKDRQGPGEKEAACPEEGDLVSVGGFTIAQLDAKWKETVDLYKGIPNTHPLLVAGQEPEPPYWAQVKMDIQKTKIELADELAILQKKTNEAHGIFKGDVWVAYPETDDEDWRDLLSWDDDPEWQDGYYHWWQVKENPHKAKL